ncbi:ionotropic receptor 75a-like isoform X2 [Nasonia vitripennis]|uniref:Ionotropic receptor 75a N-terminal domain-containing protein n=1 Tax=Nasonia vitripennis TaxID=7425 RepID=A0A7M7Q037_NASVI|nr:ionotropic receptor 75a-like isoform X2 [Nasonia vitripennis]
MSLTFVVIYGWLLNVHASIENNFFIDYFKYKNAPSMLGISCNTIEDDVLLARDFSKYGISVAFHKLTNMSGISRVACTDYWKIGIFFDTRCYDDQEVSLIFFEASEYRMFGELHYWLILGHDLEEVLNNIDDQAFGLSTDMIVAVSINDTMDEYNLYDIYNMSKEKGNTINVTFFGTWKYQQGLSVGLLQTKFQRRSNLQGSTIRAAYFKLTYRPPQMSLEEYFNDYAHATRDAQMKFGYHIMSHLSDLYNFSLEPHESPVWLPTDKQGPVARAVINNTVDFSGNTLTMTSQRTYLLKYVHQDWPFRTCFMFRNPQPTTIKIAEILRPFAKTIWYLMAMVVVIGVTVLVMVLRFERSETATMRFSNSVLLMIGSLCQQSTDIVMNRYSTRVAFLFIMIFSLLMCNYYSASVVSARLDEPIFKINDSLNEFGKMHMKMATESMFYLEFFLKMPAWETVQFYNKYWLNLPEKEKFMKPEQGMLLVKKGGFAYHTHPDVGYPFVEKLYDNREICELMEVHLAWPTRNAFGVTYNSTFIEIARVD